MKKMRRVWVSLGLVALAAASCRFSPLPDLAPLGDSSDGAISSDDAIIDAAPAPFGLELLAGDIGGPGNLDGVGAAAHFHGPCGIAVDSAGNVYVADNGNHIIRKITATGDVTTLAGTAGESGSTDGTGAAARFSSPVGVTVDGANNLYVADRGNNTIRKITAAGVVTTLAGAAGMAGSTNGTGAAARFNYPIGAAIDSAGNVYVAEAFNHTIRKITAAGVVTTLAGTAGMSGSTDGANAAARFFSPTYVAVDSAGNVYVADEYNHTIRKVTAAGVVTTLAGTAGESGNADGTGAAASFYFPSGVAVDSAGNVYVADYFNHTIRKITAAGVVTTLAGTAGESGSTDGTGTAARFSNPAGVAVDSAGNVYVSDIGNHIIRKITAAGIVTTLAGTTGMSGSTDGTGATARFDYPWGVAVDSAGNVYVSEVNRYTIRKVTGTGVVTTLAGTAFCAPRGVAVDSAGNVYVTNGCNFTICKITPAGVVTTLAGTAGMRGSTDGTGAAARFDSLASAAVDIGGNIYVTEDYNFTIRKITPAGVVTTLAGTAGMQGSTDGTGAAARFNLPRGVAVDSAGNVYVADTNNHTIRKVTAIGIVTTLAGTAGTSGSTDGTGAAARFNRPTDVAVDSAGNIYVADQNNSTIRKITTAGITTTIAGMAAIRGIVLGTTPRLASPIGLEIIGDSIIISDTLAILLLRHGARQ
ncbi:MAG TPA: hypothetical protein VNO30_33255 [Kofleriaceae bacterium]|nr:hypothetical protein [Kofleriaceae bacterium]